jgi:outer membrane protein assembly complex protein YaeT
MRTHPSSLVLLVALLTVAGTFDAARARIGVAYRGWKVTKVEIRGVEKAVASEIRGGLALAQSKGLIRGRFSKPTFQPDLLQQDMQRVRLFLAARGYPQVLVEPELTPDEGRRQLRVLLVVDTGPRVVVSDIRMPGIPDDLRDEASAALGIEPGQAFVDSNVKAAHAALLRLLLRHGYATADVKRSLEIVNKTAVEIVFAIEPGDIYQVQSISFAGSSDDLRALASRTIGVDSGALSSPKTMSDGSKRLRNLGLFRRIEFETTRVAPGQHELLCRLTDRNPRTLEFGIGAWSDQIIRLHGGWTHRNLLRGGRGLSIRAIASQVEQELSTSVWQPSILGPKTRGTLAVRGRREDEDTFESTSIETEAGLTYNFDLDRDHDLISTLLLSWVDYKDKRVFGDSTEVVPVPDQSGRLFTFGVEWLNDGSDDRFYPRRGYVIRAGVETAIPAASEVEFARTEVKTVGYVPMPKASVLALRVTPGIGAPFGDSIEMPPDRLFYAGGALSMRGFKRRRLGPKDAAGTPTGGRVLLETSAEVRVPIWWKFSLAGFVDAGQVWLRAEDVQLGKMEIAVGPGLALRTPVGPIRADYGIRITDFDTSEPDAVFHIYIGNPF